MKHFKLNLDGNAIRFTPDGKIAVVDAIRALIGKQPADRIWALLKKEHPEFKHICERYNFQEDQMDVVVGGENWRKIEDALQNFMLDPCQMA